MQIVGFNNSSLKNNYSTLYHSKRASLYFLETPMNSPNKARVAVQSTIYVFKSVFLIQNCQMASEDLRNTV